MSEPFYTADVDLAAFLRCRGLFYKEMAPNPTNIALADFVFETSDELFAHLHDWGAEGASRHVDAREFGRIRRMFFKSAQRYARARA